MSVQSDRDMGVNKSAVPDVAIDVLEPIPKPLIISSILGDLPERIEQVLRRGTIREALNQGLIVSIVS